MEALFETTISDLVLSTEKRIEELTAILDDIETRRVGSARTAKELALFPIHIHFAIAKLVDSEYDNKAAPYIQSLSVYKENLEYLKACDTDKSNTIKLNQTEWRHYFHGQQRPEWC